MRNASTWVFANTMTPQMAPLLQDIAGRLPGTRILLMERLRTEQGWGRIPAGADYIIWEELAARDRLSLIIQILSIGRGTWVVSFGWRGIPRLMALLAARFRSFPLAVRSDTNILDIEQDSTLRRMARRAVLRVLIPRRAEAWAIGTLNERFWREEVRLTHIRRIPFESPLLPGWVHCSSIPIRHSNPRAMRVLFVGRLSPEKRPADLILAFRQLKDEEHIDWSLTVVGAGSESASLKKLAQDDSRIIFVGSEDYEALGRRFAAADILVLPSQREPWGLVVNEALGYGLYVIASDRVGAATDLLGGERGATYPVGNVDRLAQTLRAAVSHLTRTPVPASTDTAELIAARISEVQ